MAVPLRGSLLLIKRHWSLLLSTARHITQHHSNGTLHTEKAPPSHETHQIQEQVVPETPLPSLAPSYITLSLSPIPRLEQNRLLIAHNPWLATYSIPSPRNAGLTYWKIYFTYQKVQTSNHTEEKSTEMHSKVSLELCETQRIPPYLHLVTPTSN